MAKRLIWLFVLVILCGCGRIENPEYPPKETGEDLINDFKAMRDGRFE